MGKRIYVDNSATSFPKPPAVSKAMADFASQCGASAGRGAYAEAKRCERIIATCRSRMAELINAEGPDRIVFTMNCSEGLTIALRGLLNTAGPVHAIATAMEHNSVLRPLNALKVQTGLQPEFVPCDADTGLVSPADIEATIRPETKLIACVHVSNVTGTIQPVEQVVHIARRHGIAVLIDSAQAGGHLAIDVQALGADFVAFAGHKGLLGPLGTGVLYIRPGMEERLATMKEGGTGTVSERPVQPETMPDKYEIGSHNAIGLAGLSEGLAWLLEQDFADMRAREMALCEQFSQATADVPGLTVYGPKDISRRTGVFSVNVESLSPVDLADTLESHFGLCTRPGLHCAPLAHRTIGTFPNGTCRLSFGHFTTSDDVFHAAGALAKVADRAAVN